MYNPHQDIDDNKAFFWGVIIVIAILTIAALLSSPMEGIH